MNETESLDIQFIFIDESKEVQKFVNAELERISPYLRKIIGAFYALNWGGEFDENTPEVQFTMPFRSGMPTGGPYNRVFEFEFYTDSEDVFHLYVNEWKGDQDQVAKVELKFSNLIDISLYRDKTKGDAT